MKIFSVEKYDDSLDCWNIEQLFEEREDTQRFVAREVEHRSVDPECIRVTDLRLVKCLIFDRASL